MRFVALDFETASHWRASICQVGIAVFDEGKCIRTQSALVDPETEFDPICISVHGIHPGDITGAAKFPEVFDELLDANLSQEVIVTHTAFDRVAIEAACQRYAVTLPDVHWLDSSLLARRTWREVSKSGYGLRALADRLEIEFNHHDAAEDARAAGLVVVAAAHELGLDLAGCGARTRVGIAEAFGDKPRRERRARKEGPTRTIEPSELELTLDESVELAAEGGLEPLEGHGVVFTGKLSIVRAEAEEAVCTLGGEVARSPKRATTVVVVGEQDLRVLGGHEKSKKHRKAEELIARGQEITILGERDFVRWVRDQCS